MAVRKKGIEANHKNNYLKYRKKSMIYDLRRKFMKNRHFLAM